MGDGAGGRSYRRLERRNHRGLLRQGGGQAHDVDGDQADEGGHQILALSAAVTTQGVETKTSERVLERSWNYVTLGYGHGESWWREFVALLRTVGYDGVLSIEHEDCLMTPIEGVTKSVELLRRVVISDAGDWRPPAP